MQSDKTNRREKGVGEHQQQNWKAKIQAGLDKHWVWETGKDPWGGVNKMDTEENSQELKLEI